MAPVLGGFGFADVDPTSFDSNPEAFMDKDLDGCMLCYNYLAIGKGLKTALPH